MAFVTILYLLFLFAPMALLLVGSFGQSWSNTLLHTPRQMSKQCSVACARQPRRTTMSTFKLI